MFSAWGDESGSNARKDPGTYLIAAAIVQNEHVDPCRDTMGQLLLPHENKVHWRDDSDARRREVINAVLALPVEGFVVVRQSGFDDHPERARRKCLERLVPELESFGCSAFTLESRGATQDRRDMAMVDTLRRSRAVTSAIKVHHQPGPKDPLLWISDALCGAVVASRTGDPSYLRALASCTTVELIDA